jgi:CubicO group peptidase (beta-lactamase class C family)
MTRRRLGRSITNYLLAVILLCSPALGRADAVDDLVKEEMRQRHVPGLTLAVIRDGKTLKAQGYGLANVEHQVPAKRETVYQSGSVGKQFTATAVMQLVEEGRVRLDDPVGTYFPEAPKTWEKATIRHLLNHTTGMWDRNFWPKMNLREDMTEEQLLRAVFSQGLTVAPGFAVAYSNAGYVVLGILISRVSGKPYAEFLQERIFEPLGMETARVISEDDIVPNRAAGYRLVDGKLKNQEWVAPANNMTGDGALYFTVDDLAKWDGALYTQRVLKKSSLDQMWAPTKTDSGAISEYGFGWAVDGIKGHRRVHHAGAWQGFSSSIQRYYEDRLTVIVLMNLAYPDGRAGEVANKVARLYLAESQTKRD